MSTHSSALIGQQMYTRERRGVFRSTEGFDTVAKSDSLELNFIKKTLHPFCLYDAPAELSARGEKDETRYPAALHLFHTEGGETVLGESRYQAADFTGLRSAFFTHNYVIPSSRAEEVVSGYGGWLHAEFASAYGGEPGGALLELSGVPVRGGLTDHPEAVLRSLGIGETLFKSLLNALMISVGGKKKMYVALDVPVEELSGRAADLAEVLMSALPFEFRRRLGVLTYASEPKSRKYIHLTFVEKGSIRQGDRATEKDFVFDLSSGRTPGNEAASEGRQAYADFAWEALKEGRGRLDEFGRFADGLLDGETAERRLSPAAYNELAVYYAIEQGDERLFEEHKTAVLSGLLSYLKPEGAMDKRVRLNDLFLERFDREFDRIRQKGLPEPGLMEVFGEYFLLTGRSYRGRIVDYMINGMLNAKNAGEHGLLEAAYGVVERSPEVAALFFAKLLGTPVFAKMLFDPYIESQLDAARRPADVLSLVCRWGRLLPEALHRPSFVDGVYEAVKEKLQRDSDPVAAALAAHDVVEKAEKERRRNGTGADTLVLLQELAASADRYLLNLLDPGSLSREQLLDIPFLRVPPGMENWNPPLDHHSRHKVNVLRAASRWFGGEDPSEELFADLNPMEMDDVQLLGRRWLKEAPGAEPFERVPLAFYHKGQREGGPLEYEAVLDHIRRKAGGDRETVYRFLKWSEDRPLFAVSRKKLQPGYRQAILNHFKKHDREAFKSRDFRRTYVASAGPALQQVYEEARGGLASPLARWLRRSRFPLLIGGMSVIILILIAAIVIRMAGGGEEAAAPAVPPSPSPSPAAGQDSLAAVYATPSGEREAGSLTFAFAGPGECAAFNPASVAVEAPGGDSVSYAVSGLVKHCQAASPGGTDEAADAPAAGEGADAEAAAAASAPAEAGSEGTAAGGKGGNSSAGAGNGAGDSAETGAAEETAGPDASQAGPGNTGAAGGAGAGGLVYTAVVTLEGGAVPADGSLIKAGGYTLKLMTAEAAAAALHPSGSSTPADTGDGAGNESPESGDTPVSGSSPSPSPDR